MTWEELRDKALSLPYEPGVYLMSDRHGKIIYVGKAKKLKNRVSQYFQDSASHTGKTRRMVSQIFSFDTIVARTEFEALVLECSLIKRHMPKYNILLKDDKGYPYIRIDLRDEYPVMTMTNRFAEDGAQYFGPFGSRTVTQSMMDTIRLTLRLPGCSRQFPRDRGKERPCLNFQLKNCEGWCRLSKSPESYRAVMDEAVQLLQGRYRQVADELRARMLAASDDLRFEQAAELRDRLSAIESLGEHQLVTAGSMAVTDVVGFYQNGTRGCFTVLHYVSGNLLDKEYQLLPASDSPEETVAALVKQYYLAKQGAVKEILLPFPMEDGELFEQLLRERYGRRVRIRAPQRGDGAQLVAIADKNAREEAERVATKEEKQTDAWSLLRRLLGLETMARAEAYDVSNLAGTDIVASMTVFSDGRPVKKDYRRFKMEDMDDQDDYGAMRQTVRRRFTHYLAGDKGFDERPDVLLIDGGSVHAGTVERELDAMGLRIPVFGMVKDGRHRTRALVRSDGGEIGLAGQPAVFALVGRIQEETHRFAIEYNRTLRSRHMKTSELEKIPGIGPKRRAELLKKFHSAARVREASLAELEETVPGAAAAAVYRYFHPKEETP